MFKHVVMWKLKEEAEGNKKAVNLIMMKEKLLGLKPIITQLDSIEVGININPTDAAFDMTLISTHKNETAYKAYIEHSDHQAVLGFILKVITERKVVDFEY